MLLTRKQFLNIAGPGALGAAAHSAMGLPRRAEATETRDCEAYARKDGTRFSFRAGASALAGVITRPFNDVIEGQASTALTSVGGYDSARVENFRYKEIVAFRAGYTQVIGSEHQDSSRCPVRETLASAVVEGLNVAGMVTADRVVARLTSARKVNDVAELPMLPTGSYFENLRIAGTRIDDSLKFEERLLTYAKKSEIEKTIGSERDLPDPDAPADSRGKPARGERWRCSIFKCDNVKIPGATIHPGCRIEIPGFGTIYLGELVFEDHARQLNMIRLELGSPGEGRIVICAVEGDGRGY